MSKGKAPAAGAPKKKVEEDHVKVCVRMRPFNDREIKLGSSKCIEMFGESTQIRSLTDATKEEKLFTFDFSYDSSDPGSPNYASQARVFEDLGVPLIDHAWNGFNCSIFAYGQTGSGKSYSMMGYKEDKGLIPLGCEELFRRIDEARGQAECQVEVSYLEIYNEQVKDLLSSDIKNSKKPMKIRENKTIGVYVEGLTKLLAKSYDDIRRSIDSGNKLRTVAATKMNDVSSRSHSVFNIMFTKVSKASTITSKISLIDLAGSERQQSTQAEGDRLKEACAINKSLSALGNVINALASQSKGSKKFIPYRDSVLTRLLQDALGGNAKTVMVATLSPADDNYDETLSTLKYADRAKQIVNSAEKNENKAALAVSELHAEIARLKELLETDDRTGGGNAEEHVEMQQKLQANEELIAELTMSIQEKEKRSDEIVKIREQAMEDMGISMDELSTLFNVDADTPRLINLNADPMMSENLVYFLKPFTRIGKDSAPSTQDIVLRGFHVNAEHCIIEIQEGVGVVLTPFEGATTFVNGTMVTEPVLLQTGNRIIFGNNYIFRFHHPAEVKRLAEEREAEGLPPLEVQPDWEFAMKELQAASGQGKSEIDPNSEFGTMVRLVEETDEANDMCEALKRKMIFSVELHHNQKGERLVAVRATNLLTDSTKIISVLEFETRFLKMQELFEKYEQTGVFDPGAREDDPFFDPPSDQEIGSAGVPLGSLMDQGKVTGWYPIFAGRYKERKGELYTEISVNRSTGSDVAHIDEAPINLRKLVGQDVDIHVRVRGARNLTTEFRCGVFIKFSFPPGSDNVSERCSEDSAEPMLNYHETFTLPVTDELFAMLKEEMHFEVWGHEDINARDPDALAALLKQKEEEEDVMRKNFSMINGAQAKRIQELEGRIMELEQDAFNVVKDEVVEFRKKKANLDALLRTLHTLLPSFQTQLERMLGQVPGSPDKSPARERPSSAAAPRPATSSPAPAARMPAPVSGAGAVRPGTAPQRVPPTAVGARR